ncbi:MAG: hypothetical protein OXH86_06855 [Acidimicrobiaceae bacterium]|nr:hypothetical protein [Acidimicrobiaceae bacterium]MDE0497053.1 hypothetical protein [Acidimicrobiaceae bacterium]
MASRPSDLHKQSWQPREQTGDLPLGSPVCLSSRSGIPPARSGRETLKNEAADQVAGLDIDWENFGTDGDEQQKLLDVLNPVLQQNNIEIYTIDDITSLWTDIGKAGRGGAVAVGCYAAVEAALAKVTKGKSLKKASRHAAAGVASGVCGGVATYMPVPDTGGDDDDSDDGGHPGGTDAENNGDDGPDAPDNTDYTYDGGAYARRMCAQYNNAYFCGLVAANEQNAANERRELH